jgi:hypothetical protein
MDEWIERNNGSEPVHMTGALKLVCQKCFSVVLAIYGVVLNNIFLAIYESDQHKLLSNLKNCPFHSTYLCQLNTG